VQIPWGVPPNYAYQLGLSMRWALKVEAAQDAPPGKGLVVLYEVGINAVVFKQLTVVAFVEVASLIFKPRGFKNFQSLERCVVKGHVFRGKDKYIFFLSGNNYLGGLSVNGVNFTGAGLRGSFITPLKFNPDELRL